MTGLVFGERHDCRLCGHADTSHHRGGRCTASWKHTAHGLTETHHCACGMFVRAV